MRKKEFCYNLVNFKKVYSFRTTLYFGYQLYHADISVLYYFLVLCAVFFYLV